MPSDRAVWSDVAFGGEILSRANVGVELDLRNVMFVACSTRTMLLQVDEELSRPRDPPLLGHPLTKGVIERDS